jgi:hypothetical protein
MDGSATPEDFDVASVFARTERHPGDISPPDYDDWEDFKHDLTSDLRPIATTEPSIFVLGAYGEDGTYDRLRTARRKLRQATGGEVYLLEDVIDVWDYWTTKFKVVASFSTHIVGIYEHSDGGHVWEAGYLDSPPIRDRTYVLKREYAVDDPADEPFDPMFAHFMKAHRDQSDPSDPQYFDWCLDDATDAASFSGALETLSDSID